ncbi:MAG TPA: hypothetical protein VFP36_01075 [Usitatibacter sp.]|nr:hypothetical protein [Usitatibacter sp.]
MLPLSLDDIVGTAAVAFEGTCLENRSERDPATNLVVTYTTFAVHDVIKGTVGSTHTIKQVGGELPQQDTKFKVHGVPSFTVGEDYVIFLAGISSAGFSSPIGLAQGKFNVHQGAAGAEVANGRDFREMTANIPDTDLPPGLVQKVKRAPDEVRHLGLDEFKQLARRRAGVVR